MSATKFIQDLLVGGALAHGGSWGGPECAAQVSTGKHVLETTFWLTTLTILFLVFGVKDKYHDIDNIAQMNLSSAKYKTEGPHIFDKILGCVHFLMYAQIIYYKYNMSSLINLIQPCHLILLFEGIALVSDGSLGIVITTLILPSITGTLLAIFFPDTSGLEQPFEEQSYWIQHYLIISVPVYLLQRRKGIACDMASITTISIGLWLLAVAHWTLYEAVDVSLNVNVEFMLCPTGAMKAIFPVFPQWLFYPSYRSTLTWVVVLVAVPLSYAYINMAKFVLLVKSTLLRRPQPQPSSSTAAKSPTKKTL